MCLKKLLSLAFLLIPLSYQSPVVAQNEEANEILKSSIIVTCATAFDYQQRYPNALELFKKHSLYCKNNSDLLSFNRDRYQNRINDIYDDPEISNNSVLRYEIIKLDEVYESSNRTFDNDVRKFGANLKNDLISIDANMSKEERVKKFFATLNKADVDINRRRLLLDDFKKNGIRYDENNTLVISCIDIAGHLKNKTVNYGVQIESLYYDCYGNVLKPIIFKSNLLDDAVRKIQKSSESTGNNFDGQGFLNFVSIANKRNQDFLYPEYASHNDALQKAKKESDLKAWRLSQKNAAEANAKAAQAKQAEIAKQEEEELRKWNSLSNAEKNAILQKRKIENENRIAEQSKAAENSKRTTCLQYEQALSTHLSSTAPGVYMGNTYSSGLILLMKNRGCI